MENFTPLSATIGGALIGLAVPGIRIVDPGCVAKTFPGYWDLLEVLRSSAGA